MSSTMSEADEKTCIEDCSAAFKTATGIAPRGWLEPGNAEPSCTLPLVAAAGYDYTLD